MFTLGYIPLIAIFGYILVILALKVLVFSLYNNKVVDEKIITKKEAKKDLKKENGDLKNKNNKKKLEIKDICKNVCLNIRKTYVNYVSIFSILGLTLIIGIFTYLIYTRTLEKTYLGYIDTTKNNVYSLNDKLKEEIKKLNKDITDITIKYSVYPYKEELSKQEQQEDIAKASGTTNTYSNGQTQNTSPIIQDSRYNVETRV